MNISVISKYVNVSSISSYKVRVELIEVEKDDILSNFPIIVIIDHFDKDNILDQIGIEYVKTYFDLKENN